MTGQPYAAPAAPAAAPQQFAQQPQQFAQQPAQGYAQPQQPVMQQPMMQQPAAVPQPSGGMSNEQMMMMMMMQNRAKADGNQNQNQNSNANINTNDNVNINVQAAPSLQQAITSMDPKKMATIFLYAGAAIQFILCMGMLWDKQYRVLDGSGKTVIWTGFFGINDKRIGLDYYDDSPKLYPPEFYNANDVDDDENRSDMNRWFFSWVFVLLALAASFISGVIRMVYACLSTSCDSACGNNINIIGFIQIVFQVIILIGCAGSINRTSAIIKDANKLVDEYPAHESDPQILPPPHGNYGGGAQYVGGYGVPSWDGYSSYYDDDYYRQRVRRGGDTPSVKPAGGFVTIVMVLLSTLAMVGAEAVVMRSKGRNGRTPTRLVV